MNRYVTCSALLLLCYQSTAVSGPFNSHLDEAVSPASIAAWGTTVVDYSPTSEVDLGTYGITSEALGPANSTFSNPSIVSLGDLIDPSGGGEAPGSITIGFQATIIDGPGPDFAVFENAFDFTFDPNADPDVVFAELAYVEVSSNGTDFARFPSTSLNVEPGDDPNDPENELFVPFGRDFAGANTTNINNLAGVNLTGSGTPFDLSDLVGDPLVTGGAVDLDGIQFVRLIDIPGDGTFTDSTGNQNPILDAWHTTGGPGGFDLDAIGAINKVPEPTSVALFASLLATAGLMRRRAKTC